MNPIKKGNILVILVIAILAFGTSNIVASFTNGDVILDMLNITKSNETQKLAAVSDGNFSPITANQLIIKVENKTNNTNNTNHTNHTNITDDLDNDPTNNK